MFCFPVWVYQDAHNFSSYRTHISYFLLLFSSFCPEAKYLFSLRFLPSSLCLLSQGTTFPRIPCQRKLANGRQVYKDGRVGWGRKYGISPLSPSRLFSAAVVVSLPCFQIPLHTPFFVPAPAGQPMWLQLPQNSPVSGLWETVPLALLLLLLNL